MKTIEKQLYIKWYGMKNRCLNPRKDNFKHYGGKGIKVCERWLNFDNFLQDCKDVYVQELERRGVDSLQIDRIDDKKGYEPSNCRFVTRYENLQNREVVTKGRDVSRFRKLGLLPHGHDVQSYANELGISRGALRYRLIKMVEPDFKGWKERYLNK